MIWPCIHLFLHFSTFHTKAFLPYCFLWLAIHVHCLHFTPHHIASHALVMWAHSQFCITLLCWTRCSSQPVSCHHSQKSQHVLYFDRFWLAWRLTGCDEHLVQHSMVESSLWLSFVFLKVNFFSLHHSASPVYCQAPFFFTPHHVVSHIVVWVLSQFCFAFISHFVALLHLWLALPC